jgi:hypothetical protein
MLDACILNEYHLLVVTIPFGISIFIPAVTAVGYEPYHYRTTSDHQGLFLDLDVGTLFEMPPPPWLHNRSEIFDPKTCKVTPPTSTQRPHTSKSNHFLQSLTTLLTTRDDDLAVRLDNLLVQACQHGEKQCRK